MKTLSRRRGERGWARERVREGEREAGEEREREGEREAASVTERETDCLLECFNVNTYIYIDTHVDKHTRTAYTQTDAARSSAFLCKYCAGVCACV